MRVLHRTVVTVAMSALFMVALVGAAVAQDTPAYPPAQGVACDTSTVTAGSSFECGARGFEPNSTVAVQATGETTESGPWTFSTTVTADADGIARATIQVPDDATGPASVSFSGEDPSGNLRVLSNSAAVNVTQSGAADGDADGAPADDQLSATGGDVTGGIIAVIGLLVVGGGLLVLTRRRQRADA